MAHGMLVGMILGTTLGMIHGTMVMAMVWLGWYGAYSPWYYGYGWGYPYYMAGMVEATSAIMLG
jgi:hypothetical protein